MHLFELTDSYAAASFAASASTAPASGAALPPPTAVAPASVPEWALGCFRRRSITYFTGAEDDRSEVVWLQSRSLTADFRRHPPPPSASAPVSGLSALRELPQGDLLRLARVEGGLALARWDGALMHWSNWHSFQTHAKWPEPGRLERVGSGLIEFSPSGAYVEDWRFQPCAGRLIGLHLIDERDARSGQVTHRGGGLIVCGQHAAFVRGRPEPLPEGVRLEDHVTAHVGDAAMLERVFTFDASYGTTVSTVDDFTISLSTLPWREGELLLSLGGFLLQPESGTLLQRVEENGRFIERRFTIDTLERQFSGDLSTRAAPSAVEWLKQEGDTLFATIR
jgi:hypothetical protein